MLKGWRVWRWLALAALVLLITGPPLYDAWQVALIRSRVKQISVGDSAERVKNVLGEPTTVFHKTPPGQWFARDREAWVYGSNYDWSNCFSSEFPFFGFPIRLRLFGPDQDDVVIHLDDAGNVVGLVVP